MRHLAYGVAWADGDHGRGHDLLRSALVERLRRTPRSSAPPTAASVRGFPWEMRPSHHERRARRSSSARPMRSPSLTMPIGAAKTVDNRNGAYAVLGEEGGDLAHGGVRPDG